MIFSRYSYLITLFFLFQGISAISQENNLSIDFYNLHDSIVGKSNTGIYNGHLYVEKHRIINEKHKFFKDFNFTEGKVFYKNQMYGKVLLRYDVFEGRLIIRHSFDPSEPEIVLNKQSVLNFTLLGHQFKHLTLTIIDDDIIDDYFEILVDNEDITLLKRYKKRIRSRTNERIKYHEFTDDYEYIVKLDGIYNRIQNSKKLSRQFPNYADHLQNIESQLGVNKSFEFEEVLITIFKLLGDKMKLEK